MNEKLDSGASCVLRSCGASALDLHVMTAILDPDLAELVEDFCRELGCRVSNPVPDVFRAIVEHGPDVLVVSLCPPRPSLLAALREMTRLAPVPVVAFLDESRTLREIELGESGVTVGLTTPVTAHCLGWALCMAVTRFRDQCELRRLAAAENLAAAELGRLRRRILELQENAARARRVALEVAIRLRDIADRSTSAHLPARGRAGRGLDAVAISVFARLASSLSSRVVSLLEDERESPGAAAGDPGASEHARETGAIGADDAVYQIHA